MHTKISNWIKEQTANRQSNSLSFFEGLFLEKAIILYEGGLPVKEVAKTFNLSPVTVYYWFRKFNVQLRTTPNWSKYRKVARQRNELKAKVAQQFAIHI